MGNAESTPATDEANKKLSEFLEKIPVCGQVDDADSPRHGSSKRSAAAEKGLQKIFNHTEGLCATSPSSAAGADFGEFNDLVHSEYEEIGKQALARRARNQWKSHGVASEIANNDNDSSGTGPGARTDGQRGRSNPTSALLARALVSEVTDNPKTMTPSSMAERERKLLKAQQQAKKNRGRGGGKPVGAPGGIGNPTVLDTLSHAIPGIVGNANRLESSRGPKSRSNSASVADHGWGDDDADSWRVEQLVDGGNGGAGGLRGRRDKSNGQVRNQTITIGLSLSRRHTIGHPSTVTRQSAFDFNELQDRAYKYVSSTDSKGWRAGGGEAGGLRRSSRSGKEASDPAFRQTDQSGGKQGGSKDRLSSSSEKDPSPDTVHIPIIEVETGSQQVVDAIISALATGEIFIPHMTVLPEALSVNGVSPPDLVVRFGTERNDDLPPDEWPNWCLEFMHNQIYEYFHGAGAKWSQRPFSITLAKKVRWKTVKHMNRYFAHAERVIDAWRERGPQYLDPQLAYIQGDSTPEEVAKPHGIYLMRDGVPTNYFPPNFEPPYTTKMTRSLLLNVLEKSWDKKRREWTSQPIPRLVTPSVLLSTMCGCGGDNGAGGFMANEVTIHHEVDTSHILDDSLITRTPKSTKAQHLTTVHLDDDDDEDDLYDAPSEYHTHDAGTHDGNVHYDHSHAQGDHFDFSAEADASLTSPRGYDGADSNGSGDEHKSGASPGANSDNQGSFQEGARQGSAALCSLDPQTKWDDGSAGESFQSPTSEPMGRCMDAEPQATPRSSRHAKGYDDANTHSERIRKDPDATSTEKSAIGSELVSLGKSDGQMTDRAQAMADAGQANSPGAGAERKNVSVARNGGDDDDDVDDGDGRNRSLDQKHEQDTNRVPPAKKEPPSSTDLDAAVADFANGEADSKNKGAQNSGSGGDVYTRRAAQNDRNKSEPNGNSLGHKPSDPQGVSYRGDGVEEEKKEPGSPSSGGKPGLAANDDPSRLASDEDWLDGVKNDGLDVHDAAHANKQRQADSDARSQEKHAARQRQAANGRPQRTANNTTASSGTVPGSAPGSALGSGTNASKGGSAAGGQHAVPKKTQYATTQAFVERNSSGVSLEYSLDSTLPGDSSTFGGSTVLGQHIPTDASVSSKNSARRFRSKNASSLSTQTAKDDDHASSFSLQESTSSLEVVPTDEDLFAVGWAKAMDPKSGSFYYFTLDRSKIVWDNPLSAQHSADSAESSI